MEKSTKSGKDIRGSLELQEIETDEDLKKHLKEENYRDIPMLFKSGWGITGSFLLSLKDGFYALIYSPENKTKKRFIGSGRIEKRYIKEIEEAIKNTKNKILFLDKIIQKTFEEERNFMRVNQFFGWMKYSKTKNTKRLYEKSAFFETNVIHYSKEDDLGNILVRLRDECAKIPYHAIYLGDEVFDPNRKSIIRENDVEELEYAKEQYEENLKWLDKAYKSVRLRALF